MVSINNNFSNLRPSASIAMMDKARTLKAQGVDVISLAGGEPDFDTPAAVVEAGIKAIREGHTHYTMGRGIVPFRERICRKLQEENGISCGIENILVTPGGKYAIFCIMNTFVNPGDEVIILDPSWLSYAPIVQMCGGVPVKVPLSFADNYTICAEAIEQAITPKTRLLIVNSPNNPTGRVMTQAEADAITSVVEKHDILLLSDEVYEKIIFDGRKHISLGAVPAIADKVFTVNSLSKSAAMTGWRVGYLCAAKKLVDAIYLFYQHTLTCISEFSQIAAITAMDCTEEMQKMCDSYAKRGDMLCGGLSQIPGITCLKPEGAFYAWAKIDKDGMDDAQISNFLLEKAQVLTVAGREYGHGTENCVRMCFAASETEITNVIARVKAVL